MREYFYVLGQYYRGDQLLNIYAFSTLRQWLLQMSVAQDQNAEVENRPTDVILECTVQYCLRALEQCDRSEKPNYKFILRYNSSVCKMCR